MLTSDHRLFSRHRARLAAPAAAVLAVEVVVAMGIARRPTSGSTVLALLIATVAALALALTRPGVLSALVLPAAFAYVRVIPPPVGASGADVMLGVAVVFAVVAVPWHQDLLRRMLGAVVAYEAVLGLSVLSSPTHAAVVEWGHRILLVAGGVAVGASLAHWRRIDLAIRLFLATSAVVAVVAIADTLSHGLAPAYPFGLQKNPAGLLLVFAALLSLTAPARARLGWRTHVALRALFVLGLLACQSRGASLAFIAGLLYWSVRTKRLRRGTPVMFLVAVGLVAFVVRSLPSDNGPAAQFNSINSRRVTYDQAIRLWQHSPLFGVGLKYFLDPTFATTEPHNLVVAGLGESGLVGLSGLVPLFAVPLLLLRRRRDELALAAGSLLITKVVASLFDIFWVAGTMTIPWVLVGVALVSDRDGGPTTRRRARNLTASRPAETDERLRRQPAVPLANEASLSPLRVLRIYHSAVVSAWRERDRQLRQLGVDLRLLSAKRWDEGGSIVSFERRVDYFASPVRTFGRHPYRFFYGPFRLRRLVRSRPVDIVDVHEEPASLAAAELRYLRRRYQPQSQLLLYCAQNIPKRYPVPFRWFERQALREASAVYCCNEAAGAILRDKGFTGRLVVLGLGVDLDRFQPRARTTDVLPVGYVGRLEEHKGVHVLIEAVAANSGMALEIVGDGPYREQLERLVARLGVGDRVRFLGYRANTELADVYHRFSVLAVPSLDRRNWIEQFGRVAVEAMASGIPVVASDSGALPEVVGAGGVLVPPGDVQALAAALADLHGDPDRRADLGREAVRSAQRYSWPSVARQHHDLYRAVVDGA